MARLGHVAVDSTRIRGNAARRSADEPREQRARYRRQVREFQNKVSDQDPNETPGLTVAAAEGDKLQQQMSENGRLRKLPKARKAVSRTDPDTRFLRSSEGWVLGYTGELAVSDDHFIVGQRVTQNATDNGSLVPMVDEVERLCKARPEKVSADAGFFSGRALHELAERGIDTYVPDNNLSHEMNTGEVADTLGRSPIYDAEHQRMRAKLRTAAGRKTYRRRQALVEPVFGVLKQQRGMRRFHRRGLAAVQTEWCLASIAFNLRRMIELRIGSK
jgi:hypothetical protein